MSKYNVKRLIDGSNQSWYWLGFLLADGSFTQNCKRVKIDLAEKDQIQVKAFVEYLGKDYTNRYCGAFMDSKHIPEVGKMLGLATDLPKTYNAPDLKKYEEISNDQFLSLIIGFIDGDGCIRLQTKRLTAVLTLKLHSAWLDFLQYCLDRVFQIYKISTKSKATINKAGYAYISISNFQLLKDMKCFIIDKDLKVLDRKWGCIDGNLLLKNDELSKCSFKVNLLNSYNVPTHYIADILEIDIQKVSRLIRGYI